MGWEILVGNAWDDWKRIVFFCNTADEAFGPVLTVEGYDSDYIKTRFYDAWPQACIEIFGHERDPRSMGPHDDLHQVGRLTLVLAGFDEREEYDEIYGPEVE